MSVSVTSASYDQTTGSVVLSGTRPTTLPVTVGLPGGGGSATVSGTSWSFSTTLTATPAPPILVSLTAGTTRKYTFKLAGTKITDPDDSDSIKVTLTSLSGGALDIKGDKVGGVTGLDVTAPGGGGSATVTGDKWSFADTLSPAPTGPISVVLTAHKSSGDRVMTLELSGSNITGVAMD